MGSTQKVATPEAKATAAERLEARIARRLAQDRRDKEILRNFDVLPDQARIPPRIIAMLLGKSLAGVYDWCAKGLLPKMRSFGPNSSGLTAGEVRAVLARANTTVPKPSTAKKAEAAIAVEA